MNFPFYIARRYLFSKKRTNMVNVITGVSIFGLCFGTAALLLILSVFNGFEKLLIGMQNTVTPDLVIQPARGKTFNPDSLALDEIMSLAEVKEYSRVLEELALFEFKERREGGLIRGVDERYRQVTEIDSIIIAGDFVLFEEGVQYGIIDYKLVINLGMNIYDPLTSLRVYVPKKQQSAFGQPFSSSEIRPSGAFSLPSETENRYMISSLELVQDMLGRQGEVSRIALALEEGADLSRLKKTVSDIAGDRFTVLSSEDQNAALQKIIRLEKWMGYAILCLALILVALNLIGTLWMIVLDKKVDISILKSLGASDRLIQRIFMSEGLLICLGGMLSGFLIAFIIYGLQQEFGLVPIPEGFILDAYPMQMKAGDLLAVAAAVFGIGFFAILLPALKSVQLGTQIREE